MEWIKAETKLPENDDDVLLLGKKGYEIYNFERENFERYYQDIAHWTHLVSPVEKNGFGSAEEKEISITEEDIGSVILSLADRFKSELMSKTEEELEDCWFFKWEEKASLEQNLYEFHSNLTLYGNFCRRWEEAKNGSCCVVERVRDKYLMPKIREFIGGGVKDAIQNNNPRHTHQPE